MKLECPTFLRSKGKALAVTFSDDEVSDHESSSDKDVTWLLCYFFWAPQEWDC